MARDQHPVAHVPPESERAPLAEGSAGGVATPRNFLVLSAGESVVKVLTFFVFTYLGRTLGPAGYGNLEFTFALMTFFALSVDLGLSTYGAREIAKQRSRAAILLRDICLLRALLAVGLFAVLVLVVLLVEKNLEVKILLIVYGVSLLGIPGLLHWFFQGHDLMHWVAVAQIIRQGVFAALVFAFLTATTPLFYIGLFECASVAAVVLFCVWIVRRNPTWRLPEWKFDWPALLKHLREGVPIGLCDLAWAVLWYFSTVLLHFMVTEEELGWFGAAHRASGAVHTFVWLYFFNLLPSISRCVGQPRESLLRLMERSQRVVAWGGVFVALLLTVLSRELLMLAYGAAYENAAAPFSVLIWVTPIASISGHYRYTLVAYNLQKWLLYWTALSALVGALAGPLLISRYGPLGAAVAALGANVAVLGLCYGTVRRRVIEIPFAARLGRPLLALALSLSPLWLPWEVNPWLRGALIAAIYLGLFVWFERRNLPELIRSIVGREASQDGSR